MYKMAIVVSLLSLPLTQVFAVDTDAVVGGAIGGGLGAAVGSELGGREGAIAGSAIGAAVGTAIATGEQGKSGSQKVKIQGGGPPAHAYGAPPGHVKHGKKSKKYK